MECIKTVTKGHHSQSLQGWLEKIPLHRGLDGRVPPEAEHFGVAKGNWMLDSRECFLKEVGHIVVCLFAHLQLSMEVEDSVESAQVVSVGNLTALIP